MIIPQRVTLIQLFSNLKNPLKTNLLTLQNFY